MTRKPTTKSSDERRLRKLIRQLLSEHISQSKASTDYIVREFLDIIDDEVRRTRMSYSPVTYPTPKSLIKVAAMLDGMFTCGGK